MNFWNNFEKDIQALISHRGIRIIRAENTISAFEQAILKYRIVEFDVTFSSDGIPVIIHDSTLERTSNVKDFDEFKAPYSVVDYTYKQLQKLDFGSWFIEEDPYGTIKDGIVSVKELKKLGIQRILTLKELLIFLRDNNTHANIEIKDLQDTKFDKIAVREILKIVDQTDMQNNIIISSFNHNYLKQVYKINSSIETAALQEDYHPKDLINYLKNLHVQNYNPSFEITDKTLVRRLNKAGFYVNVYTVNEQDDIDKLFKWKVKSVFTDV